jgi:BirA family biotin operon repressor/biotin-[acetyl-CoA-carboxylase] ligase
VEEFGLVVNKVHGRGYRLLEGLQWLDRELILTHLGQEARAFHLEILDTVESTNSLLLQRSSIKKNAGELSIAVLATELQTGGRGRRGREWHSGLGDGLTFSLVWRFQQGANLLSGLSLAVGVAIARVLRSSGVEDAALKWPNDVLIDGRKIAGILIELQGDMLGPTTAVIGIGINLKLSDSVKDRIDQSATDLYSVNGKTPDRNHLMAALLLELTRVLRDFECHGFAPFREEWVRYHAFENQSVQLQMPDGSLQEGLVRGVGEDGSLILSTPLGDRIYNGGEISLRKVS